MRWVFQSRINFCLLFGVIVTPVIGVAIHIKNGPQVSPLGESHIPHISFHRKSGVFFSEKADVVLEQKDFENEALVLSSVSSTLEENPLSIDDLEEEVLVLPKKLLNNNTLHKLGLGFVADGSHLLDFYDSDLVQQHVLVPRNIGSLFVFNTSDPLNFPMNNLTLEASKSFLEHTVPFDLPKFSKFLDFFMVIPYSMIRSENGSTITHLKTTLFNETISVPGSSLFRKEFTHGQALLVFLLDSGNLLTYYNIRKPVMNVKNYLPVNGQKNGLDRIFDRFAESWIKEANFSMLVHSAFCTINLSSRDDSYCLRIEDNNSKLKILRAFNSMKSPPSPDTGDKLSKRDESKDILLSQPSPATQTGLKSYIGSISSGPQEKQKEEIATKLKHFPEFLVGGTKKFLNMELKPSLISGKYVKGLMNEKLNFDTVISSNEKTNIRKRSNVKKTATREERDSKVDRESSFLMKNEDVIFPLSLMRNTRVQVPSPRKKSFSQVVFKEGDNTVSELIRGFNRRKKSLDNSVIHTKREISELKHRELECEKITWYNVFHHSIFGNKVFCI